MRGHCMNTAGRFYRSKSPDGGREARVTLPPPDVRTGDTGSAIVGPARADLYWGSGDDAGRIAGRIRHSGRFVMLLPRELDLVATRSEIPLPVPKPRIAGIEVAKHAGKSGVESAGAATITEGRRLPLPAPKLAALTKLNGKGNGLRQEAVAGTEDRRA